MTHSMRSPRVTEALLHTTTPTGRLKECYMPVTILDDSSREALLMSDARTYTTVPWTKVYYALTYVLVHGETTPRYIESTRIRDHKKHRR